MRRDPRSRLRTRVRARMRLTMLGPSAGFGSVGLDQNKASSAARETVLPDESGVAIISGLVGDGTGTRAPP